MVHVVAGGAAGAVASAVTTPLDVVKTLLNTQETGIGLTKGMKGAISQVCTFEKIKFPDCVAAITFFASHFVAPNLDLCYGWSVRFLQRISAPRVIFNASDSDLLVNV